MKQETNKEMDLLLRRLGRRDDATVSDAAGDHLDADELNAYAENLLPAAARARYTAHLAECPVCRGLVVQLSSSAGVVLATESTKVPQPSALKKFLGSLFTPMVMRYAAPALGLIVVAAIGFVILRRDQSDKYVTQVTNNEQSPAAVPTTEPSAGLTYSVAKPTESPEPGRVETRAKSLQAQSGPVPNAPPAVSSVEAEVSKDAAAAQPKPEEQKTVTANEPPPSPKAAATPAPEESPRAPITQASKNEVKELPAAGRRAEGAFQAEQRDDRKTKDFARKPADEAGAPGTRSSARLMSGEGNLSANARTVAGRRFQKKGGIWIDTAYDSSKDQTTLTRGSEQYRALVADEPAIKTIADELEGEIIVVWKGRTYRIR